MNKNIKILGFSGSLRRNSYNSAALRAARELLPEGTSLEIADLSMIPFINEDVEAEGVPQMVEDFKNKIAAADALLIATPEYNYSIPPVLKFVLYSIFNRSINLRFLSLMPTQNLTPKGN